MSSADLVIGVDCSTTASKAVVWNRNGRATAEVKEHGTAEVHRITGKPPNPTPAWYKLLWLKTHEPETIARTAHVADVAGYLVRKLTGEWTTSWACADPLGLVDLWRFDYDDRLLAQAGLSRAQVSRLLPPGAIAGRLRADVATHLGLPAGLPIVVGVGDGQSAGLGCNVTKAGRAYLNPGTGTVSGVFADAYSHAKTYRSMGVRSLAPTSSKRSSAAAHRTSCGSSSISRRSRRPRRRASPPSRCWRRPRRKFPWDAAACCACPIGPAR
jgi:sugar (pentulose or hexulose) kinase